MSQSQISRYRAIEGAYRINWWGTAPLSVLPDFKGDNGMTRVGTGAYLPTVVVVNAGEVGFCFEQ